MPSQDLLLSPLRQILLHISKTPRRERRHLLLVLTDNTVVVERSDSVHVHGVLLLHFVLLLLALLLRKVRRQLRRSRSANDRALLLSRSAVFHLLHLCNFNDEF